MILPLSSVCAQSFDFYQDGLKDLYLDYLNTLSKDKVVEVYRDVTYWNLFGMREKGWNGGLRNVSLPLPDGNCLWMHTDSYFGRISEIRDRAHYNNRVNNAAQIQTGEKSPRDFVALNEYISTDKNYPATYYMAYDWLRHPDATLQQEYLQMGFVDDMISSETRLVTFSPVPSPQPISTAVERSIISDFSLSASVKLVVPFSSSSSGRNTASVRVGATMG